MSGKAYRSYVFILSIDKSLRLVFVLMYNRNENR